ncbi:MAG: hypothetical protein D6714_09460 [Bacteroidetes bacterium]|nr:MAG: hypothetical protein D6714_09460 [Bacteroidota bacterium]
MAYKSQFSENIFVNIQYTPSPIVWRAGRSGSLSNRRGGAQKAKIPVPPILTPLFAGANIGSLGQPRNAWAQSV